MVDRTCLENRNPLTRVVSSNLTSSAFKNPPEQGCDFFMRRRAKQLLALRVRFERRSNILSADKIASEKRMHGALQDSLRIFVSFAKQKVQ